ncbi:MAG: RNA polymerase sigma factor [Ruminiclostridium sp.]|nr:RNA polymerase sigma factor [Ruminiclostridium sp.]MBQ9932865.1 RNA polymerase sigma factor [Ruminiclostridium sp.]
MKHLPANTIEEALDRYGDRLYRLALVMLKRPMDAEDAVQEVFLRYLDRLGTFQDAEHEKAWLLRVTTNQCRDILRARQRHPKIGLDQIPEEGHQPQDRAIWEALMALPEKYREVLVLHAVEGYRVEEIAKLIGKTPSAVKMRLSRGRKLLEESLGKE